MVPVRAARAAEVDHALATHLDPSCLTRFVPAWLSTVAVTKLRHVEQMLRPIFSDTSSGSRRKLRTATLGGRQTDRPTSAHAGFERQPCRNQW